MKVKLKFNEKNEWFDVYAKLIATQNWVIIGYCHPSAYQDVKKGNYSCLVWTWPQQEFEE